VFIILGPFSQTINVKRLIILLFTNILNLPPLTIIFQTRIFQTEYHVIDHILLFDYLKITSPNFDL